MEAYDEFLQRVQDIHRLSALQGHLGWDQEVLMPSKGSSSRGEMMAWLAGKRHEQLTDARMGELLTSLEKESLGGVPVIASSSAPPVGWRKRTSHK